MPNGSNNFALPVPGPQGPAGATGAQGPQGDPGETGPQGPAGVVAASAPVTYDAETQTIGIDVGSTAGTVCAGDDSRLSDTRDPNAHTHPQSDIDNLESDLADKLSASVLAVSAGYVPYFDGTNLIDSLISQTGSTISVAGLLATVITLTNTSGATAVLSLAPTYNQTSGTAANTDLRINRTNTAVGSGTQRFLDCQIAGTSYLYATASTSAPDFFVVNANGSASIGCAGGGGGITLARGGHSFSTTIQNPLLTGDASDFVWSVGGVSGGRKGFAWQSRNAASVVSTLAFNGEGQLGVNTTNPLEKLHVVGNGLLGARASSATATPVYFSFGGTYGTSSPGSAANLKWYLFDDGIAANAYGIGMSSGLMEIRAGNGAAVAIYTNNGTEILRATTTAATVPIGQLHMTNATSNRLGFGAAGVAAPGAASAGQKIQLYGTAIGTVGVADFALGIESGFMWFTSGGGYKFYDNAGSVRVTISSTGKITSAATAINLATQTPASASATGTTGDISWDANYIYVCTATNTWKRAALATW